MKRLPNLAVSIGSLYNSEFVNKVKNYWDMVQESLVQLGKLKYS